MKNSKPLLADLMKRITLNESEAEIRAIVEQLIESIGGLTPAERLLGKPLSAEVEDALHEAIVRVNRSEPVQYIVNEAHFFGRSFYVNPSVLIPRPETEELVALILARIGKKGPCQRVVDVATGSGCIATTLALELHGAQVWGTDISEDALKVAARNASSLTAVVNFVQHDILSSGFPAGEVAILVSNPPYIAESEKDSMDRNVLEYEPHQALFVRDSDPLIFYSAIARHAGEVLVPGGLLALEINARFGREVARLLTSADLAGVEVCRDLTGKDRFVLGYRRA